MISEISIENLGVISKAELSFTPGMTALTGETGAGKTMVLTSLLLLMGAKATGAKVRHGQERAIVTGVFTVPSNSPAIKIVEAAGGHVDQEKQQAEIIVSRQVLATGRSRAYLGGVAVPVATLREIAALLFTVHGQQDQIRLASKAEHLKALDEFAKLRENKIFAQYQQKWQTYQEIAQKLASEQENVVSIGTERLALEALIKRVDRIEPQIGEDDELRQQAARLDNVETLRAALSQSIQLLDGDEYQPGVLSMLDAAQRELNYAQDPQLQQQAQILYDSAGIIAQVSTDLSLSLGNLDADPAQLAAIHERRAQLTALIRELGMDIPTMLARRTAAKQRLTEIVDPEKYLAQLQQELTQVKNELTALAQQMTQIRKKAAKQLAQAVTAELGALAMASAQFTVEITPLKNLAASGGDDIEFLLSPHTGAPFGKINATASGGEISRIMLAIEVALAGRAAQPAHTFIFDEVDAGIGGETALSIGRRLGALAQGAQVIVVTHLAQVAAVANTHIVVEKESGRESTQTTVRKLPQTEREIELARMLSGHADSEVARTHAAELIAAVSMAKLESGVS